MMSTHGKVTDFQMWDEVLPDEQLLKVKTETHTSFILAPRWRDAKSSRRATWWAGRRPIGSSTQVAARSSLTSLWWSIQIFTRLGRRLLTLRGMFAEAGTSACTWCPTSSRLSLCTESCCIFSLWFSVWPGEPAHVHQVIWRGCAVQQEREVWLNCPAPDSQVTFIAPPSCCLQGICFV